LAFEVKDHLFGGTAGFYLDFAFHVWPFKIPNFTLGQVKLCFPGLVILIYRVLRRRMLREQGSKF
jgi:hypothetical protein